MLSCKVIFVVSCLIMVVAAEDAPTLGGVHELTGEALESAEHDLRHSLTKLADGDGPHYTVGKVHSATSQVVSGSLLKFKVDLVDQKTNATKKCKVAIWSQPWLENGIEVTFDCEGEKKLVKQHSA